MARKPRTGLTGKQARFVQEYLIDLNATQAATRAGYSAKTAYQVGFENLNKPDIKAAIVSAMETLAARTAITQDRVLSELAKMGFANMLDYVTVQEDGSAVVDLSALDRDKAAAIQEVTVESYSERAVNGDGESTIVPVKRIKFKLSDKRGSLELIGKHLGMFPARMEHTGKDGGPIETKDMSELDLARTVAAMLAAGVKGVK